MVIAYIISKDDSNYRFCVFYTDIDLSSVDNEEVILRFKTDIKQCETQKDIMIPIEESPFIRHGVVLAEDRCYHANEMKINELGNFDKNYEYHFWATYVYDGKTPILDFISFNYFENENGKENNMACNSCCKYFSYVTGASVVDSQLILTLNNTPTIVDENHICFRFNCNIAIPTGASTLPVYIAIGGTNYPLWNKYGDVMLGSDLIPTTSGNNYCPRFTYHAYFGEQTSGSATITHIIVHNIPRVSCTIYFNN